MVALGERVGQPGRERPVGEGVPAPAGEQPLDRQQRQPSGLGRGAQLVQRAAVGVEPSQQPQARLALGALQPVEQTRRLELALVHRQADSVSASTARWVGRAAS